MGSALWADSQDAQIQAMDTIAAVSLVESEPEKAAERAAVALLERAKASRLQASTAAVASKIHLPFFRLSPEERLVLVGLHGQSARWSYERLGRVLNLTIESIQELAWSARVRLCGAGKYPAGPQGRGLHCPEYLAQRPWTQRFLDDEIGSGQERFFLQNHLMACDGCRATLTRARDVFGAVGKQLPPRVELTDVERLQQQCREAYLLRYPGERTFLQSLRIFFSRRETILFLLGLLGLLWLIRRW